MSKWTPADAEELEATGLQPTAASAVGLQLPATNADDEPPGDPPAGPGGDAPDTEGPGATSAGPLTVAEARRRVAGSQWQPDRVQAEAKVRLYRWLDSRGGTVDVATITLEMLTKIMGTRKVATWLRSKEYAAWLFERDAFAMKVQALKEAALEGIAALAFDESGLVEPKDRLKALNTILELGGAFPRVGNQTQPVYADPDLAKLSDVEVDRQLRDVTRQLGTIKPVESK